MDELTEYWWDDTGTEVLGEKHRHGATNQPPPSPSHGTVNLFKD